MTRDYFLVRLKWSAHEVRPWHGKCKGLGKGGNNRNIEVERSELVGAFFETSSAALVVMLHDTSAESAMEK